MTDIPKTTPAILPREIADLVRQGRTIEAVRELQAQRRWPLSQALGLVRRWQHERAEKIGT